MLKEGTKVSWQVKLMNGDTERGSGVTIADEHNGHVLVAVDSLYGEPNPGYHLVIWCATTWLKVEALPPAEPAPAPPAAPATPAGGTPPPPA